MKKAKESIISPITIFFSLVFLYFLLINSLAPLLVDDYFYSLKVYDYTPLYPSSYNRIENLGDIVVRLWYHYFEWGGRIVAHFLGMLFLWIGKPVFNLLNSLIYCLLLYLIFFQAKCRGPKNKEDILTLISIFIMSWFTLPVFGQIVFWLIGSVNYLWTIVIILAFLVPYRGLIEHKLLLKDSKRNTLIFFFTGTIAGCTNENTAAVSLLAIALIFLFKYISEKKPVVPKWFYSGFIGQLTGFLFLILAPGNYERLKLIKPHPSMTEKIINFLQIFLKDSILKDYLLWVVLFITILILIKKLNFKKNILAIIYIFLGLLNYFILILSPDFPERACFGGAVFIIIGIISILSSYLEQNNFKNIKLIYLPVCFITIFSLVQVTFYYVNLNNESGIREQQIIENKKNFDFKVKELTNYSDRHIFVSDVQSDQDSYPNTAISLYYGIKSISLEPNPLYKNLFPISKSIMPAQEYNIGKAIILSDLRYSKVNDGTIIYFILNSNKSKKELLKYRLAFRAITAEDSALNKFKYLITPDNYRFYVVERYDFDLNNYFKIDNDISSGKIIFSKKIDVITNRFEKIYLRLFKYPEYKYVGDKIEFNNILLK